MTPRKVVMISSTARDLPEHREQVRLACERAGFEPREMMEHLTALLSPGARGAPYERPSPSNTLGAHGAPDAMPSPSNTLGAHGAPDAILRHTINIQHVGCAVRTFRSVGNRHAER